MSLPVRGTPPVRVYVGTIPRVNVATDSARKGRRLIESERPRLAECPTGDRPPRRRKRPRPQPTPSCFAQDRLAGYTLGVTPEPSQQARKLWKPHPDDEADVREALESVDRGELLSVEASEAFLRWLEGSDDESWRAECE